MALHFEYFAAGLFQDLANSRTELRVIALPKVTRQNAATIAEDSMLQYAKDFGLQYCGVLNVFEAGSDMIEQYGEVFSMSWHSDSNLDKKLLEAIADGPDAHPEL